MPNIVLVVSAHPDDMEFLAGGTVAKMVEGGSEVSQLIVTNGERGTLELEREELIRRRREEANEAGRVLGLKRVEFLDYPDGMLSDFRFNEVRERIMAKIRKLRPDTIITWDPFAPYETHQDHRITAMATAEAAGFANLPLYHPEQIETSDDLVTIAQTYYIAKHHLNPNHAEDITNQINKKIRALLCHRTQMEFLLESTKQTLEAQGKPRDFLDAINPKDHEELVGKMIRGSGAIVGKRAGVPFAEEFRLSRIDGLSRYFEEDR
ncbi:MAG: PIG-L family deacetylase [Theionarchaea archaeon]|nr:PIG-L family deacetylase [Theionarchaea archaeon]